MHTLHQASPNITSTSDGATQDRLLYIGHLSGRASRR